MVHGKKHPFLWKFSNTIRSTYQWNNVQIYFALTNSKDSSWWLWAGKTSYLWYQPVHEQEILLATSERVQIPRYMKNTTESDSKICKFKYRWLAIWMHCQLDHSKWIEVALINRYIQFVYQKRNTHQFDNKAQYFLFIWYIGPLILKNNVWFELINNKQWKRALN